jgi:NAD-dependent DNA ligase
MKYIEKKKFNTGSVDYKIKDKITTEYLSEMLLEAREKYKYEIDGLVVIDSSKYYPIIPNTNPEFGFAFKQVLTDQIAETTVIDVIWEISKDKYIKPKIKIDTVEIGGAEINYATANNAKFVYVNKLGPGSKIKLIRSGDVIPKIEEILTPSDSGKPKMPSFDYEWNETEVDIIATNLDEDNMSKLIVKKLSYFFSTLDIKFMGEATVQKFVDNGFDDLWKILKADKNLLKKINGLGAKSVDKIYKSIDDGLTNRKLYDIMSASQVFGRGIGSKKFKIILDAYPNIIDIFKTKGKNHVMKLINELSGFDVKTTNKIIDSMDAFIEYYKELVLIKPNIVISDNTENLETKKITSEFSNYLNQFINNSIVFTGFRDTVLQSKLQTLNIKITDSVSKNTKLVIASDVSDNSSKLKKAKELNIPIISKQEFTKLITK